MINKILNLVQIWVIAFGSCFAVLPVGVLSFGQRPDRRESLSKFKMGALAPSYDACGSAPRSGMIKPKYTPSCRLFDCALSSVETYLAQSPLDRPKQGLIYLSVKTAKAAKKRQRRALVLFTEFAAGFSCVNLRGAL